MDNKTCLVLTKTLRSVAVVILALGILGSFYFADTFFGSREYSVLFKLTVALIGSAYTFCVCACMMFFAEITERTIYRDVMLKIQHEEITELLKANNALLKK